MSKLISSEKSKDGKALLLTFDNGHEWTVLEESHTLGMMPIETYSLAMADRIHGEEGHYHGKLMNGRQDAPIFRGQTTKLVIKDIERLEKNL